MQTERSISDDWQGARRDREVVITIAFGEVFHTDRVTLRRRERDWHFRLEIAGFGGVTGVAGRHLVLE